MEKGKLFHTKAFLFSYKARICILHFSSCLFLLCIVSFVHFDSGNYNCSKGFNRQFVGLYLNIMNVMNLLETSVVEAVLLLS